MKKSISLGFFFFLILVLLHNSIATPPCIKITLPPYVEDIKYNYENFAYLENTKKCEMIDFKFSVPKTYSKYNISYSSYAINLIIPQYPLTFEEYDLLIKQKISLAESCPNFEDAYQIADSNVQYNYLIGSLGSFIENNTCTNYWNQEFEFQKKLSLILSNISGYKTCKYNLKDLHADVETTIECDNIKERLLIKTNNNSSIEEAYFLDNELQPYRQIYPKDLFLKERTTLWTKTSIWQKFLNWLKSVF